MKKQSLITLLVLVALSATLFFGYYFQKSRREGRKAAQTVSVDISIDVKNTGSIQTNNVLLRYNDGEWIYEDPSQDRTLPVSTDTITDFLERVENFQRGRLVEKTPSNLEKYGLSFSEGQDTPLELTIKSKKDDELLHLLISKNLDSATYARFGKEESIYKVDSSLHRELEADSSYWLDKRLFQGGLDVENVRAISFSQETGGGFVLKRDSAKDDWEIEGASDTDKIKEDEVERYLKNIQSASGSAFADLEMDPKSKIADITLVLNKEDSSRGVSLYRVGQEEAMYYVQEAGREYALEITEYMNSSLFQRGVASFLDKEVEPVDVEDSENQATSDSKE